MRNSNVLEKSDLGLARLLIQKKKQKQFLCAKEVRETSYADVHKFHQRYGFVFYPQFVSKLSFFKKSE
jgi:hypothetical protein